MLLRFPLQKKGQILGLSSPPITLEGRGLGRPLKTPQTASFHYTTLERQSSPITLPGAFSALSQAVQLWTSHLTALGLNEQGP